MLLLCSTGTLLSRPRSRAALRQADRAVLYIECLPSMVTLNSHTVSPCTRSACLCFAEPQEAASGHRLVDLRGRQRPLMLHSSPHTHGTCDVCDIWQIRACSAGRRMMRRVSPWASAQLSSRCTTSRCRLGPRVGQCDVRDRPVSSPAWMTGRVGDE